MESTGTERKLAAILHADVVGYSRLMADDEAETVRALKARRVLMGGLIRQHAGRVVDAVGDDLLAEFPSVVDAVACAVAIQNELAEQNRNLPTSRRMLYRIGVNLGDVIVDEDRIYGDGVNIAARIQALAEDGGVTISGTAFDQVKGKLGLGFQDLGERRVKNIAGPLRVYRVSSAPRVPAPHFASASRLVEIKKKLIWLSGVVAVVLAFIAMGGYLMGPEGEPFETLGSEEALPLPGDPSIAVLPLVNLSGDAEQEYFSDGMTEALISNLGKIRALRVISRTSVMQYKGVKKPLRDIANELGVDVLMEGSVMRANGKVRITTRLVRARPERQLWAESYERDLQDILSLQREVARAIAEQVQAELTPQETRLLADAQPVNPKAHEAYLKGSFFLYKLTAEGARKAIIYFQEAIDLDPEYPMGYLGLGSYYAYTGTFGSPSPREAMPKAKKALEKALKLDDTLSEAHALLGSIKISYDRDWSSARVEFDRALELSPNSAAGFDDFLLWTGQYQEAIAGMRRVQVLDPLNVHLSLHLGWILYFAGRYDEATEQLLNTIELDPNWWDGHYHLGQTYEAKGMLAEAVAELRKAVSLEENPVSLAGLGHAYAVAGERSKALGIVTGLEELSKQTYVPPYQIAAVYSGLGENEPAFAWLEEAYDERDVWLPYLFIDPMFDALRADPRLQDLLRRMNFPE